MAGALAGLSSWVFLATLDWAITTREDRARWLVWLLPVAAFGIAAIYHHFGGRSAGGTTMVIDAARIEPPTDRLAVPDDERVPRRLAVFVTVGCVLGHLFGASVGREGTALQSSGSLGETAARVLRLDPWWRRELLVASIAGGFGAVFGVPFAGTVFALEVCCRIPGATWRERWSVRRVLVIPATVAAFSGDLVVRLLGHHHTPFQDVAPAFGPWVAARLVIAGLAFGGVAWLYHASVRTVRRALRPLPYPPLRAAAVGSLVVLGAVVAGRQYLSLSVPLAVAATSNVAVAASAWLWKLLFTAASVGGGLPGGEITPLFVIGALTGATVGRVLGLPVVLLASIGFAAVFGAAARAPAAAVVVTMEIFGPHAWWAAALVALGAVATRGRHGLYDEPAPRPAPGSGRGESLPSA